jgi:hypothetical protein
MPIIVPLWFYEFGSVMYFFAAIIGFLLTYFSFKLYNYTRKKSHLLLNLSFAFITIGFIVLTVSNTYSHFNFEQCHPDCVISQQEIFNRVILGNYVYYLTSIIGYSLFLFSYNFNFKDRKIKDRKSRRKLFFQIAPPVALNILFQNETVFVLFPFESQFFQPFHLISAILLMFIVFRTFSNYRKNKSNISLLVPAGFAAILFYHILMFSIPFSPLFFAFAHLSLLAGFSMLLLMLIKVTKK